MKCLDLIISVDTFPAHLAEALAIPTWLILTHLPDRRWDRGHSRTPWYPTMRLFRQKQPGDWGNVVERITIELSELARVYGVHGTSPFAIASGK